MHTITSSPLPTSTPQTNQSNYDASFIHRPWQRDLATNNHKIIKSGELKFPGNLNPDDFFDEFEHKLHVSAINHDDALPIFPSIQRYINDDQQINNETLHSAPM